MHRSFGTHKQQIRIDRVYWNFEFPSTSIARNALKDQLFLAITKLEKWVQKEALQEQLTSLQQALSKAATDKELNAVRRNLIKDFRAYTQGRPLFGKKIGPTEAKAGSYKVKIISETQEVTGKIDVREDPIMSRSDK